MNLDLFMADHLRRRLANHFRTQFWGATESTDGKAFTGTGPERGSTPRPSTTTDSSSGRTAGCYPVNGGSNPSSVATPESSSGRTSGPDPANEGSNPSSGSITDREWLNATYVFPIEDDGLYDLLDADIPSVWDSPEAKAALRRLLGQFDFGKAEHYEYCYECGGPIADS